MAKKKTISKKKGKAPPPPQEDPRIFLVVVDSSPEMSLALHYACRRAKKIGGAVALLSVVDNTADFQHWLGVGNLYREEMQEEADLRIKEHAAQVMEFTGRSPITYTREGEIGPELYALLQEEESIQLVVIAAGVGNEGPGPIINYVFNKGLGLLPRPFVIIPGNISIEDINKFT